MEKSESDDHDYSPVPDPEDDEDESSIKGSYCRRDQKFQTVSAVAILLIVCVIAAVSLLAGTDPSNNIITITGRVVAFTNPFDSRLVSFQRHVDPSQECVFSAVKDFFGMPIYVFSLHSLGVKNPTSFAEAIDEMMASVKTSFKIYDMDSGAGSVVYVNSVVVDTVTFQFKWADPSITSTYPTSLYVNIIGDNSSVAFNSPVYGISDASMFPLLPASLNITHTYKNNPDFTNPYNNGGAIVETLDTDSMPIDTASLNFIVNSTSASPNRRSFEFIPGKHVDVGRYFVPFSWFPAPSEDLVWTNSLKRVSFDHIKSTCHHIVQLKDLLSTQGFCSAIVAKYQRLQNGTSGEGVYNDSGGGGGGGGGGGYEKVIMSACSKLLTSWDESCSIIYGNNNDGGNNNNNNSPIFHGGFVEETKVNINPIQIMQTFDTFSKTGPIEYVPTLYTTGSRRADLVVGQQVTVPSSKSFFPPETIKMNSVQPIFRCNRIVKGGSSVVMNGTDTCIDIGREAPSIAFEYNTHEAPAAFKVLYESRVVFSSACESKNGASVTISLPDSKLDTKSNLVKVVVDDSCSGRKNDGWEYVVDCPTLHGDIQCDPTTGQCRCSNGFNPTPLKPRIPPGPPAEPGCTGNEEYPYYLSYNYLNAAWRVDFTKVCYLHDKCYGSCTTSKAECDAQLCSGQTDICSRLLGNEKDQCLKDAAIICKSIKNGSADNFRLQKKASCRCG